MKSGGGWAMTEESTKDQAKEQVREVTQSAAEQAGQVRDSVKEQASQVADEVKTQGRGVLQRTKDQVLQQGEAQTQQMDGSLRKLGEQAQALADGRTEDAGPVLDDVRQASDRLQGMATRVEERGAQGLLHDLEEFGRRRPGARASGCSPGSRWAGWSTSPTPGPLIRYQPAMSRTAGRAAPWRLARRGASPSTVIDLMKRSIGDLVGQAMNELSLLVRKEVELAKLEMKEQAGRATNSA